MASTYIIKQKYIFKLEPTQAGLELNSLYPIILKYNDVIYTSITWKSDGLYYMNVKVYDSAQYEWVDRSYRNIIIDSQYIDSSLDAFLTSNADDRSYDLVEPTKLILYRNIGEQNRINKTSYLKNATVVNGNFRESQSVSNLQITIQSNGYPYFNYLYCNATNRYYFIDDIVFLTDNLYVLDCRCDVLMSFKEDIYLTKAKIERCEYTLYQDKEVNDPMCRINSDATITYLNNNLTSSQKAIADKLKSTTSGGEFVLICNN